MAGFKVSEKIGNAAGFKKPAVVANNDEKPKKRSSVVSDDNAVGGKPEETETAKKTKNAFEQSAQPQDLQNAFQQLEDTLKRIYKSKEPLSAMGALAAVRAIKIVADSAAPENSALKGQAVQVEGSPNRIHFHDNGDVTIDVDDLTKLPHEAALAAAAVAANPERGSVDVTGTDEEKAVMYLAAQAQGLAVGNEEEVKLIPAEVHAKAQALWDNYQKEIKEKNDMTPADVKKTLDMPVGVIAAKLADVDNEAAAVIQADLVALAQHEDRLGQELPRFKGSLDAKALNATKIAELKNEAGITEEELTAARAVVDSGQGVPDGVPKFGQILEANGLIDREVKDALLIAQAASRTLDISARINGGQVSKETVKAPQLGVTGQFPDSAELVAAQSLNFAASSLENAIAEGNARPGATAKGFEKSALSSLEGAKVKLEGLGQTKAVAALDVLLESYKQPAPGTAPKPGNAPKQSFG